MAGRSFGPYEVLARLATGGAANVFLARRRGQDRRWNLVCLKTLLPERAADPEFVEMFIDEAKLAARLSHPTCVEIFDLGVEGGTHYLAMEYIHGETLWGLLSSVAEVRRPLPPIGVATILRDVARGLHHAHELTDDEGRPYHLVHRDVSPQNVMVTFDGRTKVLDFGIARAETGRAATVTGIVKGKFSYMSPEQITGATIDHRSDVYALGIVMFECLSSRRLYRGESPEDIARLMLEKRPPRLRELVPDVDPTLESICAKALARHPQNRFQTAADMADALDGVLTASRAPAGGLVLEELVQQRFGARAEARRQALVAAERESVDEVALAQALGARQVMEVDLFAGTLPIDVRTALQDVDLAPLRERLARRASGLDRLGARQQEGDRTVLNGVERSPRTIEELTQQGTDDRLEVDMLREPLPMSGGPTHVAIPSGPAAQGSASGGGSGGLSGRIGAGADRRAETLRFNERSSAESRPFPEVVALPIEVTGVVEVSPPPHLEGARGGGVRASFGEPFGTEPTIDPPSGRLLAPLSRSVHELAPASPPMNSGPLPLMPPDAPSAPPAPAVQGWNTGLAAESEAPAAPEPSSYSLGVVLAALSFGVTLGLLLGVVLMLFLD